MSKVKITLCSESGPPISRFNWYGIKLNALAEPKTKYKNNKATKNEMPMAKSCSFMV